MQAYFPTILEGDEDEGYCADVIGTGVLGQGETQVAALTNAAAILQEIIWDAIREDKPAPQPGRPNKDDLVLGTLSLVPATLPQIAA